VANHGTTWYRADGHSADTGAFMGQKINERFVRRIMAEAGEFGFIDFCCFLLVLMKPTIRICLI
jgi:hypothetical protein